MENANQMLREQERAQAANAKIVREVEGLGALVIVVAAPCPGDVLAQKAVAKDMVRGAEHCWTQDGRCGTSLTRICRRTNALYRPCRVNTTFLLDNAVWPMDDKRAVFSVSKVWPEESSRILKPSMGKVNIQHYAIPCFYCCSFDHDIAQSQNAEVQIARPPCRRPCRYEMGGMKSGIFRVRRRYGVDPSYRMHSCSRRGLSGHAPRLAAGQLFSSKASMTA